MVGRATGRNGATRNRPATQIRGRSREVVAGGGSDLAGAGVEIAAGVNGCGDVEFEEREVAATQEQPTERGARRDKQTAVAGNRTAVGEKEGDVAVLTGEFGLPDAEAPTGGVGVDANGGRRWTRRQERVLIGRRSHVLGTAGSGTEYAPHVTRAFRGERGANAIRE